MSEGTTTTHTTATVPIAVQTQPVQRHVAHQSTLSKSGTREQKDMSESGEPLVQTGKKAVDELIHTACDMCHNWRHYPKLITTLLLLTSFLLGAGLMAGGTKMFGSRGSYVGAHWDRNTADAHHALDVILDHLHHPEMYEHVQSQGILTKSKNTLMNFIHGILPGRGGKSSSRSSYSRGGGGVVDEAFERTKDVGRSAWEKAEDVGEDVSYGIKRGADSIKHATYGVGSKLSDMAQSVKDTIVGSGSSSYDDSDSQQSYGKKMGRSRRDEQFYQEEPDDLDTAQQTVRRVLRETERNY